MTDTTSGDQEPRLSGRTRRLLGLLAVAVLAVAAVLAVVVVRGDGAETVPVEPGAASTQPGTPPTEPGTPSTEPGTTPAPTPMASPSPAAPEVAADGAALLPPELPQVALDQAAVAEDGTSAVVTGIESFEGTGTGVGNVGGPALRVGIRIDNGAGEPLDLDAVQVQLFHAGTSAPGSPLDDPSRRPFSGTLAPGESAEGVYVFSVPQDGQDLVRISLAYRPGAPFLVFAGAPS